MAYLDVITNTPPWYVRMWRDHLAAMRVHTRGVGFERLLTTHPNEDDRAFAWRIQNFEAITCADFNVSFQSISRILTDSGYDIYAPAQIMQNLEAPVFEGMAFKDWMRNRMLPLMLEDPNGFVALYPVSTGTRTDWGVIYASSLSILDADIWSENKRLVFVADGADYVPGTSVSVLIYDASGISSATRRSDGRFENVEPVWEAPQGDETMFVRLGGKKIDVWQDVSYLAHALPFGNDCLRQYSNWQANMSQNAHPIKEVAGNICGDCRGHGFIQDPHGNNIACKSCNGLGIVPIATGPFAMLIRPEADPTRPDDKQELLKYHRPPVEAIQHIGDAWQTLKKYMRAALYLDYIEASQSGVAKAYDRMNFYTLLEIVGQNLFMKVEALLDKMAYATGLQARDVSIVSPDTYRFSDGYTHTEIITEAQTTGDVVSASELLFRQAKRSLGGGANTTRILRAWQLQDPLFAENPAAIAEGVASGVYTPKQARMKTMYAHAVGILKTEDQETIDRMDDEALRRLLYETAETLYAKSYENGNETDKEDDEEETEAQVLTETGTEFVSPETVS